MMSPVRMTIAYDGRAYFGWQRHGNKPTVQSALEQAITQVYGIRTPVRGSGRTDRGAHASGQVVSVELPVSVELEDVCNQLNGVLPADIRVLDVSPVSPGFDACDSALAKHYRYIIWNDRILPADRDGQVWHVRGALDTRAMIGACTVFEGEHDFSSFATRPNFKQKSTVRTIFKALVKVDKQLIVIDIWANGFLYKMVRNIVRALVKVGEGRFDGEDLIRILEAKNRAASPGTAPASGLYLEQVFYGEDELLEDLQKKSIP